MAEVELFSDGKHCGSISLLSVGEDGELWGWIVYPPGNVARGKTGIAYGYGQALGAAKQSGFSLHVTEIVPNKEGYEP